MWYGKQGDSLQHLPFGHPSEQPGKINVSIFVRLRSQFLSKTWKVACEGELRDISQWGCRVSSLVRVPVGTELECSIFPHNEMHPFTVDQATVRWSRLQEFGLAFTNVRPGVQRQIAQLCGQGASPLR